jgi:hypothetical protein
MMASHQAEPEVATSVAAAEDERVAVSRLEGLVRGPCDGSACERRVFCVMRQALSQMVRFAAAAPADDVVAAAAAASSAMVAAGEEIPGDTMQVSENEPAAAAGAEADDALQTASKAQPLTSAQVRQAARAATAAAAGAARSGASDVGLEAVTSNSIRTRRRAQVPTPSWAMGARRRQGMGGSAGVKGLGPKGCECCGLPSHEQTWKDEMFELNYLRP